MADVHFLARKRDGAQRVAYGPPRDARALVPFVRVSEIPERTVGALLREARRRQNLSLAVVAERSGNEFKASSLGAYERGDRAITIQRLHRLASVYGVSVEALLVRRPEPDIDLVRLEGSDPPGLVIDLSQFRTSSDPRAIAIMSFGAAIKGMRKESTSSIIVVRRSDTPILASLIGCDPVDLERRLATPETVTV